MRLQRENEDAIRRLRMVCEVKIWFAEWQGRSGRRGFGSVVGLCCG